VLSACLPLCAATGNPAETQKRIAILQSNAGQFEKSQACRQLASLGTKVAVPVLAKLLADERTSHMARFALEAMPDAAAAAAFRDGLATDCVTSAVLKSATPGRWEILLRVAAGR
jgi:hypothetical protein